MQHSPALTKAFLLHQQNQLDAAAAAYFEVLEEEPNNADALHLLGVVLKAQGDLPSAERLIRKALSVRSKFPAAYYNLGNLLAQKRELAGALAAYQQATEQEPTYAEAYYAIGNCYRDMGDESAAARAFTAALTYKPDYYEARHNRANTYRELGRVDEAVGDLYQVLQLAPGLAEAHYNLALSLFTLGRYAEAAPHYEWRWKAKGFTSPPRQFNQPQWQGQVQRDAVLLVYAEQGLGDTLQFVRYVIPAAARVREVVVEVPGHLVGLLTQSLPAHIRLVAQGQPLPPFDLQVAMLSLPWFVSSAPYTCGTYLQADEHRLARWTQRLAQKQGLRVGVNWQGNPQAKIDKGRSMPLQLLLPLARIPGVRLISLQKNAGTEQLSACPQVETLGDEYDAGPQAFLDAAAVLKSLDVFITTDTALAHLAGALGVKTFLLLKAVPDWRWGLQGEKTPWYDTLTLFRQPHPGRWEPVIQAIGKTLEAWQIPATV